jgi:hypothetical protein
MAPAEASGPKGCLSQPMYGFDVAPNLSNRIGYFFFCFPEALTPMTHQSWHG